MTAIQVRAEYDGSPEEQAAQRAELERQAEDRERRQRERRLSRRKEAALRSGILRTVAALQAAAKR